MKRSEKLEERRFSLNWMHPTRNSQQSKQVVREALERFGEIDVLINNAGINQDALVSKMTEEQWDKIITISP